MASIAELRAAGATFETDEAVAIAQQLISTLSARHEWDDSRQPIGPPYDGNVFLNEDGSVSCRGCQATPTVSEVGIFLHALLPPESPHVPGSLRHTIACALHTVNVDADERPMESLNTFSRNLAGHEHGVRADIVRGVLARSSGPLDAAHHRSRSMAAAACLVAGLSVIAAGALWPGRPAPIVATLTVPASVDMTMAETPRVDVRRIVMTRAARPATAMFVGPRLAASREPSRGLLDTLHLGWLRRRFAVRDDL